MSRESRVEATPRKASGSRLQASTTLLLECKEPLETEAHSPTRPRVASLLRHRQDRDSPVQVVE